MKLNKNNLTIQNQSKSQRSIINELKLQLLYHSNKIEGSTFNYHDLNMLMQYNIVTGSHEVNDVIETINSLEAFDYVIETLGEPLSEKLIREFHYILKKNTSDDRLGCAGVYKSFPNEITGSPVNVAEPFEVPSMIDALLQMQVTSLYDIANFHQQFEHIHPFLDGNGRVGRFIMLKQCIENDVDIIAIDDVCVDEYREALCTAQTRNDLTSLISVFENCQERFDKMLSWYETAIKKINKDVDMEPDIEI